MKSKWFKRFGIAFGVLFLIILAANFAVNFWLKNQLPSYLKKNTDYVINYKNLEVDLGTGNIFVSGISINNKQPNNSKIIRIQGTVDTLRINRIGIVSYLFSKELSTDYINLTNPSLKIILAEPKDKKKNKETIPIDSDHITIKNGNIDVLKYTEEVIFSVKNFYLDVEGLAIEDTISKELLPFGFDNYHIKGNQFFVRLSDYGATAESIDTNDKLTKVKNFHLQPIISHQDFQKRNPQQLNIFDVKIAQLSLKEIVLAKKKLGLTNASFNGTNIVIFKTNAKPQAKKDAAVKTAIDIQEVISTNATLKIVNPNQQDFLNTGIFDVNVKKIIYDNETAKSPIPFLYENFDVKGQSVALNTGDQKINIAAYALNDSSGEFRKVSLKPAIQNPRKTTADMDIERIHYSINDWKFIEKKLKLDVRNVLIEGANGKILVKKKTNVKKTNNTYDGLEFPLLIKNVEVKNSNLTYDQGQQPLTFKHLNAQFSNIEMNKSTSKKGIPFNTGDYKIQSKDFNYKTKFYQLSAAVVNLNKNEMDLQKFQLKPLYSRAQFVRMIPKEKDLYTISANRILMKGNWNLISSDSFIDATHLKIDGLNANIFRSKVPTDDNSVKPLYSEQLRKINFPMYIANVDIVNSLLEYEEDTPKSDGPGKLVFNNFNLNAKNVNSGKTNGKPTVIPITVHCKFFNVSPMIINWSINTANPNDNFTIGGEFSDLPASRVNMFVEPYLKIRTAGLIQQMKFNFKGNNHGISGTMTMKHQDFKVSILKQDGEKNKLLSSVANIFVKTNSDKYPESVVVQGVKRDPSKSFFNLFWKGVEEGLALSLTGKSIVKTKAAVTEVKSTTKDVKVAVKDVKEAVGQKVQQVSTSPVEEKKESAFKRLFKKKNKEKAED